MKRRSARETRDERRETRDARREARDERRETRARAPPRRDPALDLEAGAAAQVAALKCPEGRDAHPVKQHVRVLRWRQPARLEGRDLAIAPHDAAA